MTDARWAEVRRLYDRAAELPDGTPPAEVRAFLERECAGDAELADEVWRLLRADVDAEFLESPPVSFAAPGVELGGYLLEEELGSGGTGIVFRARQLGLDRLVAVKVMPRHFSLNERRVQRFQREARAAAKLQHSGIAPIYEVGQVADTHFFAMALVRGDNLAVELGRHVAGVPGRLPTDQQPAYREMARIVRDVADALDHAHAHGVVHRDIKPQNILLDDEARVHLVDFGLALDETLGSITVTDMVEGTPYYMSPEQARAIDAKVDARTDVYSAGVVLYELLTQQRPFEGRTSQEVLRKIVRREPKPVRRLAPDVPADLARVCEKAMEKLPGDRYASAAELRADLDRFLAGQPVHAQPPGLVRKLRAVGRQHPVATSLAALVVVLAWLGVWLGTRLEQADWPRVDVRTASGVRARVQAIPLQPFLGTPLGKARELGSTPLDDVALPVGMWRFVVRAGDRVQELDRYLEEGAAADVRVTARLDAGPPPGSELVRLAGGAHTVTWNATAPLEEPDAGWRRTELAPLEVMRHEVSFGQYRTFLAESGSPLPLGWEPEAFERAPGDLPVVGLTYDEARRFAEWYGLRLPFYPELEHAAAGREGRRFPWQADGELEPGRANITYQAEKPTFEDFFERALPVDTLPNGATPEGLLHLLGNVEEWTSSRGRVGQPFDPDAPSDLGITFGGSFRSPSTLIQLPAVYLRPVGDHLGLPTTGLRCVRTVRDS